MAALGSRYLYKVKGKVGSKNLGPDLLYLNLLINFYGLSQQDLFVRLWGRMIFGWISIKAGGEVNIQGVHSRE